MHVAMREDECVIAESFFTLLGGISWSKFIPIRLRLHTCSHMIGLKRHPNFAIAMLYGKAARGTDGWMILGSDAVLGRVNWPPTYTLFPTSGQFKLTHDTF